MTTDTVSAHVEYVVNESGETLDPIRFLIDVLSDPLNAGLMIAGGIMSGR